MSNEREREAMLRARAFIDKLTVDAPDGDPKAIVEDENRFFAWDNEHRSPKTGKTFLFDWSYYIGIVMEGLYYMYEAGAGTRYRDYAKRYLHAVETGGRLNRYAGYTPDHGVDCYKTASLLPFFMDEDAELKELADALFDDLARKNARHTEDALGGNYWHVWRDEKPPRYRVWLDGLYMGGPVCAEFGKTFDRPEYFDLVAEQAILMGKHTRDPKTGLLYHAWDAEKRMPWANPETGLSPEFWGRSIGWVGVAILDDLDFIPAEHPKAEEMRNIVRRLMKAIAPYQGADGRWYQVVDKPDGEGNWPENSCTSLFTAALCKGARTGVLEPSVLERAQRGYDGVINSLKMDGDDLLIGDVCIGTGVGDYQHYIHRPTSVNDLHGVGAFLLMCAEAARAGLK